MVTLIFMLIFGVICALIAPTRGRSIVAWFIIGFFLGLIGLIIILVLPDLKAQAARENKLKEQNRRLRERMRKDRVVADQRHANLQNRLGVHDRILNVETAGSPPPQLNVNKEDDDEDDEKPAPPRRANPPTRPASRAR